jgi:hypothetical protein
MMELARNDFNHAFFMEVFIIATWQIWKQRNGLILKNAQQVSIRGKEISKMNVIIKPS